MSAKHQKVAIVLPEYLTPRQRKAVAAELIDVIVERTQSGKGVKGKAKGGIYQGTYSFPGYSDVYKNSFEYKKVKKKTGKVDLTLSGDMLGALELLEEDTGKVVIGYEEGSEENARADGNIRGTYGDSAPSEKKARNFLGVTKAELADVLDRYPNTKKGRVNEEIVNRARAAGRRVARGIETEDLDDGEEG